MADPVSLINSALLLLGESDLIANVTDIKSAPPVVRGANHFLPLVQRELLSRHPWRFAMKLIELNLLLEPPPLEIFSKQYELPVDMLTLWRFHPDLARNYKIYGTRVFTSEIPPLIAEYVFDIGEKFYPIYFETLLYTALAAEIAMMVTQKPGVTQLWKREASILLTVARNEDSQQSPSDIIRDQPILQAHFAGGRSLLRGGLFGR